MRSPRPALFALAGFLVVGLADAPVPRAGAPAVVQGPRAARAVGCHAEHVAARDAPHHEPRRGRAARAPGRPGGGRPRRPRDHVRPGGRQRLRRDVGDDAIVGRLRADARRRAAGRRRLPGRAQQRPDLRGRPDARGADRRRQGPHRPDVRTGPRRPRSPGAGRPRTVSRVDGVHDARLAADRRCSRRCEIEVDLDTRPEARRQARRRPPGRRHPVQGLDVGAFFEQQKVFQVIVRGVPDVRESLDSVRDLRIDAPDGAQVRLGDVAEVGIRPNPVDLRHEAVSRYVDVRAAVSGRGRRCRAGRRRPTACARCTSRSTTTPRSSSRPRTRRRRCPRFLGPGGGRRGRHLPAAPGRARQLAARRAGVPDAADRRWSAACS